MIITDEIVEAAQTSLGKECIYVGASTVRRSIQAAIAAMPGEPVETLSDDGKELLNSQFVLTCFSAKAYDKPYHRVTPLYTSSAVAPKGSAGGKRYRHKKRGTTYTEIGRGRLQVDGDLDMEKVVIYRADHDGELWVRPVYEFEDGRFEALDLPAPEAKEGE